MKQFFVSAVCLTLATGASEAADLSPPPPAQSPAASEGDGFHGFLSLGGGMLHETNVHQ